MLRRAITFVLRFALRVFFRRVEVVGRERVPSEGACLFVLNHPNGLVDPVFLLCFAQRRVSFLAKSPLFHVPVISFFVRALDSIPVYRRQDEGADTSRNHETFERSAELLRRGGTIAICPEGASHSEPYLLPLKTGAARIALGAASVRDEGGGRRDEGREVNGERHELKGEVPEVKDEDHREKVESPSVSVSSSLHRSSLRPHPLKIVPAGLYYTSKTTFRSGALLYFGEPIAVEPVEPDERGEPPREAVAELSGRIAEALRSLTLNADRHEALALVARAERIFSSGDDEEGQSLERELKRRRRFVEAYAFHRQHSPARLEILEGRIRQYEEELRQAGLEDPRQLSPATVSEYARAWTTLSRAALFILLSPLALAGAVIHYAAYKLAGLLATKFAREYDDVLSTFKIAAALLLFPLTWLALDAAFYLLAGWRGLLAAFVLAPAAGYVALRTREELDRFLAGTRAALFFLRERSFFRRLLEERRMIRREILELGDEAERAGALK
ncbi:MAG TPA: 1-acyl-sn-glycerol-3-phosphate acyltransferase [Pyrinomonadaceae bacterium]|nr:1-acyl-sn-glycerol-3-phosphate acyltransferase [Pyrinomonadaceae bacterium]